MLKSKSKILFSILLIIVLLSSICFATDEATPIADANDGNVETGYDTSNWTNSDLYLAEDDILIDGIVDGNVFAVGKNVTVTGEIGGDLFVIADTLTIDEGYVYSSIFGLAKSFNVNGIVYDVYAACENFTLEENGYIFRDLRLSCKDITISGNVRRNAFLNAENITFGESSNAIINGKLTYSSKSEATIPEGKVVGEVTFNQVKEEKSFNLMSYISGLLVLLVNTLALSLLAIWLTPNFVKKVSNMGIKKTLISLPIGLGSIIATFIIAILLIVSSAGISLGFSVFALACLLIAFSTAVTSMVISGFITKKFKLEGKMKFTLVALASTLAIGIIEFIPFVGGLVSFLSVILGFGTVIFNLFTKVPEETTEVKE